MSRLENQPKYKIGQEVKVKVKTKDEKTGIKFENTIVGTISQILAAGTSEEDTYEYGITTDMPGCYHYGKTPFAYTVEKDIVL